MQVVNATPWPFAILPGKVRSPGWTASVVAKASFALKPGAAAEPLPTPLPFLGDVYRDEEPGGECLQDADLAPFKPRADLLLRATCHPPGGKPASVVRVSFGVGRWSKALAIIGPRAWRKGFLGSSAGEPEPFMSMPVTWSNAFGGPGYAPNPAGRGILGDVLPVVEGMEGRVAGTGDRPEPAGYGPVNRAWPQRSSRMGTYRGSYLKERWPWFPDDFDWAYFNAAPADQQLPGYLRGDEEFACENLHPKHPLFKGRLPGIRLRAFLSEKAGKEKRFREVPLVLDTMLVDLEQETLSLVWRGVVSAASLELDEIEHLVGVQEPLAGPAVTPEQARALIPAPPPPPAPAAPAPPKPPDPLALEMDAAVANAKVLEAKHLESARALARSVGFDLDAALAKPPAGLPELRAALAESRKAYAAMGAPIPPFFDEQVAALVPGGKIDGLVKELQKLNVPKAARPPVSAAALKAAAAAPGGVARQDFTGADLAGADLAGLDLSGAVFRNAKLAKADLSKAKLDDAQFGAADLSGAKLAGASLKGADLTGVSIAGADFTEALLDGTVLADASGEGAVFAGASGAGPYFIAAKLPGASFEKARLSAPDFTRADLSKAKFAGAAMPKAVFGGAVLVEADLSGAEIPEAAGGGADLRKAKLVKTAAPKSVWEKALLDGADLSGAKLAGALFQSASLKAVRLSAADLKGAVFRKAVLQGAEALRADAFEASFEKADLGGADFSGANLYGSEFWEAVLQGTRLQGANVKATKLS